MKLVSMQQIRTITALVLTGILASSLLVGCSAPSQPTNTPEQPIQSEQSTLPYTFTDDLGNEVTVSSTERVVACMGSFANTWVLAGGTLVGATTDALAEYDLSSQDITGVGEFTAPNLELILSLEPDLVIMTGASTGRDGAASQTQLKPSLDASGIPVAYFNVTTFEDYLRMLRISCDITGRDDLYELNGTAVMSKIQALKEQAAQQTSSPSVLLMTTYSGGTRVQDSQTMTGIMLADQNSSVLRDFSLEAVIEMNPDYILVVPMGNDDEAALKNLREATEAHPAWAGLDAVQANNFITLDKTLFLYKPNNNWAESYQVLFDTLYAN